MELTIIHINRHSNLVKHCKSIFKSFIVSCKRTINFIRLQKQNITSLLKHEWVSNTDIFTSANDCRMITLVNESFRNMKHLTSFNRIFTSKISKEQEMVMIQFIQNGIEQISYTEWHRADQLFSIYKKRSSKFHFEVTKKVSWYMAQIYQCIMDYVTEMLI